MIDEDLTKQAIIANFVYMEQRIVSRVELVAHVREKFGSYGLQRLSSWISEFTEEGRLPQYRKWFAGILRIASADGGLEFVRTDANKLILAQLMGLVPRDEQK
jgi:hypothetical protein